MNNYIATFFSHYDAFAFCDFLKGQNIKGKMMPVPRKISASCGTCVSFVSDIEVSFDGYEVEAVFIENSDKLVEVFRG